MSLSWWLAVPGSVMTYALGEMGLWWPEGPDVLDLEKLAKLPPGRSASPIPLSHPTATRPLRY